MPVQALSLQDELSSVPALARPNLDISTFGGGRARFAARAALAALRHSDLVINGHVDFAPLVAPSTLPPVGRKVLTISHGIEVWDALPLHKRLALKRSERVWSVSDYTRSRLISRQGVRDERIDVIPPPLDREFLRAADRWQENRCPTIPSRLLTVTRLSKADRAKGVDEVIRAMPAVRRVVPDATFTVVGDGDGRGELEALSTGLGLGRAVQFVGHVPDSQLHAYLAGTDVFVLPSRKEGFGLVFLEAMAHGKVVIGGAHGGTPEVVPDGEAGILVRYGDPGELAQALIHLLSDEGLRTRMGRNGAILVRSRFSFDTFARAVAVRLDTLVGTPWLAP